MIPVYFRFPFCILAILLCIASIPLEANSSAIGDADRDLFQYIHNDMENGFFDVTLPVIQRMGDTRVYLGTCMLLCAFGDEKMAATGKLAGVAVIESGFATYVLKQLVGRPRPLDDSEKNSFPSGHTTLAFTMATVVGHEYTRLRIPLYVAAFGTAFARVYLGRHYPSDAVVGAVIGTLAGLHMVHYRETILSLSF